MSRLDLRAFYRCDDEIALDDLPAGTARVLARRATGDTTEATLARGARFGPLARGTYAVEALDAGGELLADELVTVAEHEGKLPVAGFATSFDSEEAVASVLEWVRALRCTVVQIYDWMDEYARPLGPESGWSDPLGRPVSCHALRALARGLRSSGVVAQAYAPVYAVDPAFAAARPDLLLYRGDGTRQCLGDLLDIANPGDPEWQRHWVAVYGEAADSLGFDGFHLDTYGYPRAALDAAGDPVDMRSAYSSFLAAVRTSRPDDFVSFNQVNGVPRTFPLPPGRGFRYVEVWPPSSEWRHLEALADRSGTGDRGTVLACYPPDRSGGDRVASLRTALLGEAITTSIGTAALAFGDRTGVLHGPYYPDHDRLTADEAAVVVRWRRFALRCRDLFRDGEDASWTEIVDENGAVSVEAASPVSPEPLGGGLLARVVRGDGIVAVALVDLTGSESGRWSEPTSEGRCRQATVRVLLDQPERWTAAAAVLGHAGDRFTPVAARPAEHREGRALEVDLPLVDGWSVLRLTRKKER